MALLHKNLSKKVDYHHDIDAYEESKTTKSTIYFKICRYIKINYQKIK